MHIYKRKEETDRHRETDREETRNTHFKIKQGLDSILAKHLLSMLRALGLTCDIKKKKKLETKSNQNGTGCTGPLKPDFSSPVSAFLLAHQDILREAGGWF